MPEQNYWRFIYSGDQDCYTNMAVDEAILLSVQSGLVPSTVRIYRWNRPSISIGYRQRISKVSSEIRIPLVRRLTGGRAVFHDDEYTISVISRYNTFEGFETLLSTYLAVSKAILTGLSSLGIECNLVPRKKKRDKNENKPDRNYKTPICFETVSVYEILCHGKKIVGSAQRRLKNTFLQQSSIPFHIDISSFPNLSEIFGCENFIFSPVPSENQLVFLRQFLSSSPHKKDIIQAFKSGFENTFNIQFRKEILTQAEENAAFTLKKEKYSQNIWNYYPQNIIKK